MPRDSKNYGSTRPDVASVREFVQGYMARDSAKVRGAASTLAAGVLTAAAVSAYKRGR